MKGLFFNSLPDDTNPTGYDRPFNADDISDFLSVCWDTGVCKTDSVNGVPQGLKVLAIGGMTVSVNVGRCAIKGKVGINIAADTFTVSENGTNANRYDYIVARYDNNVSARTISLQLITGDSTIPTVDDLAQNSARVNQHDLMLAYITVAPSVTEITQSNITDTRGNKELCPWFTPVKGYEEYYDAIVETHESTVTLAEISKTVVTDLPSKLYNERYSIIEVYTNGIREAENAYTASVNAGYIVITFAAAKAVGSKITVSLGSFIDGEGMGTALAQYTQLLADVADLKTGREYDYICNGVNDNVKLSRIATEWLNGGTDYGSKIVRVYGNFGCSAAYGGAGTAANPYRWFEVGTGGVVNRRIIFDFSGCGEISLPIAANTYNTIFYGYNAHIIGANLYVNQTGVDTVVKCFSSTNGAIRAEDCRFLLYCYKDSMIANGGTFVRCFGFVANETNNSYCFSTYTGNLLRIDGGEYYAYTGDANNQSAVIGQSAANAVSILNGVNAPTLARAGFYQTNSLLQWVGGGELRCTDLISELPLIVVAAIAEIRGTIIKNKPNSL